MAFFFLITIIMVPLNVCDSQWGLVLQSQSHMLQGWQLRYLLDRRGATRGGSKHLSLAQVVTQELHTQTTQVTVRGELGGNALLLLLTLDLKLSPAGSGTPGRGRCWRTGGSSTSPFWGTGRWRCCRAGSRTGTPRRGGGALSHLTKEEQRSEEEVQDTDVVICHCFICLTWI